MHTKQTLLLTGATGMIGSALKKKLCQRDYHILAPSHQELDLLSQADVFNFFAMHRPHFVCHLAARVGGIYANNKYRAQFIYENTQMHCNVIEAAHRYGCQKILFPGSACTYPKLALQPISESAFLTGSIEPTNIAYAAAKINGLIMCQAYAKQYALEIVLPMPTNAYGLGDNFDSEHAHVIPALMKRLHEAKQANQSEVILWGTGEALREFIFADDLADAMLFLLDFYQSSEIINVGTMQEITIYELALQIAETVGFKGKITMDTTKPDGAPRKCLDSSKLFALGWRPATSLEVGLREMYEYHFIKKSCDVI